MSGHQSIPQNIYDNLTFFEGFKTLRQQDTGLNGALEIPALHTLLPELNQLSILDLGCGFGDFARLARQHGAASVIGVDLSQRMLSEASRLTRDPAISFVCCAIEDYLAPPASFDLVVSSLALHYIDNFAGVVERVIKSLSIGGHFVFSVEHPMCTANPIGWIKDQDGNRLHWPVDHYLSEGRRDTHWFVEGVVKYHRTTETYLNTLINAGFMIERISEPAPTSAAIAARPGLKDECRRPVFLLIRAKRIA